MFALKMEIKKNTVLSIMKNVKFNKKFKIMKKLFLSAAVAMSSLAFAQQFGVKGGMNVSTISGNDDLGQTSKVGFNAGVFMNAPLAANFSIQPEVLYNNLGAKAGNNIDAKINLDYISVPVMFQYNATPQFYFEAGPEFSFLVNTKVKSDNAVVEALGNQLINTDTINTFNFGVGIGAGYWFTPNVGINARYVAGVNDIVKDNTGDSARNNNFQVGLAYKFGK